MSKNKLPSLLKRVCNKLYNISLIVGALLSFIYLSARAPEIHGLLLREYVGSKVYMIRGGYDTGGGTGFAVKAPSGKSYILTNDHVCDVSIDKKTVLVSNDYGMNISRKILDRSTFSDLCLIEGITDVEGLSVGSEPYIGQIVAAIGHPSLMNISLSRGEIIMESDVKIIHGPIALVSPSDEKEHQISPETGVVLDEDCRQEKHSQIYEEQDLGFLVLKVKMCIVTIKDSYRTNMIIQPGSSGSPAVDFFGNVVGVVFASDGAGWGSIVPQKDIVRFLKSK